MVFNRPMRAERAGFVYTKLAELLAAEGITVSIEDDPYALADTYRVKAGKEGYLFPVFDPEVSDVSADNFFWIRMVHEDDTIGIQAVRIWETGDLTLGDHMRRHLRLYCRPNGELDVSRSMLNGKACWETQGRIVYQGQFWLSKAFRGREVAGFPIGRQVIPRLGHSLLVMSADPNLVFGLCPDRTTEKGIIASYGFYQQHMAALRFVRPSGEFAWYETLLTSSREEMFLEFQRTIDRIRQHEEGQHPALQQPETQRIAAVAG